MILAVRRFYASISLEPGRLLRIANPASSSIREMPTRVASSPRVPESDPADPVCGSIAGGTTTVGVGCPVMGSTSTTVAVGSGGVTPAGVEVEIATRVAVEVGVGVSLGPPPVGGVFVGSTGVSVGGTGVPVGGTGVSVRSSVGVRVGVLLGV